MLLLVAENIFNQIINEVKLINLFHRINEVANRVAFIRRTIRISATFRIWAHSGRAEDGNETFFSFYFFERFLHRFLFPLCTGTSFAPLARRSHFSSFRVSSSSRWFFPFYFCSTDFSRSNFLRTWTQIAILLTFCFLLSRFWFHSFYFHLCYCCESSWPNHIRTYHCCSCIFLLFSFHFIGFLSVHFKLSMLEPSAVGSTQ